MEAAEVTVLKSLGLLSLSSGSSTHLSESQPPTSQSEGPAKPSHLCLSCSRLWSKSWPNLKYRKLLELQRGCPLCRLIFAALRANVGYVPTESLERVWCDLRQLKFHTRDQEYRPKCISFRALSFTASDNYGSESVFISRVEDYGIRGPLDLQDVYKTDVCLVSDMPNVPLLQSWIGKCHDHGTPCSVQNPNPARRNQTFEIMLVDVRKRRLVRCTLEPNGSSRTYLAFSYVRGASGFFPTTIRNLELLMRPGGLLRPEVQLPETFVDAMDLVEMLGQRYLWIDVLCMVQGDRMRPAHPFDIIDQIYSRAFLTIVDLSRGDLNSGLPGVRPGSRSVQQVGTISNGGQFVGSLRTLPQAILQSRHHTCAWAFQETYVSRKCLFVSDDQFFFKCKESTFSESLNEHPTIPQAQLLDLGLPMMSDSWSFGPWAVYQYTVEQYTKRKPFDELDVVNAFRGALQWIMSHGHRPRGDFIMDLLSPLSLLWVSVEKGPSRRSTLDADTEEYFPSWSWTGWTGPVTHSAIWIGRSGFDDILLGTNPLTWSHQSKMPGEISLEHLESSPSRYLPRGHQCAPETRCYSDLQVPIWKNRRLGSYINKELRHLQLFRFYASVGAASKFSFPSWFTYYSDQLDHKPITVPLLLIFDSDGEHCGALINPPLESLEDGSLHDYSLVALSSFTEKYWREGFSSSRFSMLDGRHHKCQCFVNVMLVKHSEKHSGLVERVAIGRVYASAWSRAGPKIKTVMIA